jgi:hypothetical protein
MAYAAGIVLASLTALMARLAGFDRDRAFYPTLVIVIASYYVLFAAMGASVPVVLLESGVMTLFAAIAVAGFRSTLWLIVAALAGHGLFDLVHGRLVPNPGVPPWWPIFCLSYDIVLSACLAWLLTARGALHRAATAPPVG